MEEAILIPCSRGREASKMIKKPEVGFGGKKWVSIIQSGPKVSSD
jgi:hypothetical protein